MKTIVVGAVLIIASAMCVVASASGRDSISVVGSSTVFPFAKVVAERFGRSTKFKSPTVESTGTGGGFKEFCKGIGVSHPDISNASRRMKASELAMCRRNGVKDIIEVLFGYDGIVLANSIVAPQINLSRKQLFLALAKMVPNPDGSNTLVKNPNRVWRDIDPRLPAKKYWCTVHRPHPVLAMPMSNW